MTTPDVAAMLKYADNSFHAVKVTFANEMGAVARSFGVDARAVMDIFCLDTKLNISTTYLKPGMPYGGSCLPKDLRSLVAWARANTVAAPMLEHVAVSNEQQIQGLVAEILRIGRARVGMIGLAFKDNTDDMRESPMVAIAEQLYGKGRALRIFDNNLTPERLIGANRTFALTSLPHLASLMTATSAELVAQSDIVVVARNLGAAAFSGLPWRRDQVVFDLIGLPEGAGVTGQVHGLYWPGTGETAAMIGAQDERELA
jgi:GDP-mannose 6-dehydrogenase